MDSYFTLKAGASGSYKESGSKFISLAIPVGKEEEIEKHLQDLRKKYFDATHICYAYLLEGNPPVSKAHDAGEPRHSAGPPILNQIRSFGVSDALVVVVRYFGGTKLGLPGLSHAYKSAARSALEKAGKAEKFLTEKLIIRFDFEVTGQVMKLMHSWKPWILESRFDDLNTIFLTIRRNQAGEFRKRLAQIQGLSFQ